MLWLPFYDVPEKIRRLKPGELAHIRSDADAQVGDGAPVSWLTILRYRQAWSFIVGKFLTDPVWWFFLIWLPDFFKKTRGLDIKGSRRLPGVDLRCSSPCSASRAAGCRVTSAAAG